MARGSATEPRVTIQGATRVVAVGGGKGGVGKTFLVANLAVALARLGRRVVVVDADLEGANLHTCLGLPMPPHSLADFVAHREQDVGKLAVETRVPGLRLIAGTHAHLGQAQPGRGARVRLMRALRAFDSEFVIVDLGAGTHAAVLDYFLLADEGVVVVAPEPTSVENAYAFLRAAYYRRLRLAAVGHGVRQLVTQAMDQRNERGIRTPLDLLREVKALDPVAGGHFERTMREFRPRVVVNEVRSAEDVELGFAVCNVCHKYFGIEADYLGYVNHDPAVRRAVLARRPVVEESAESDAAVYLGRIARKILGGAEGRAS
jgi:flagellar biosynthesis protein FlhG